MRSGNYASIWNLLSNPGCSSVCCWNSWLPNSSVALAKLVKSESTVRLIEEKKVSHTCTLPNIFSWEWFFNIVYGGFLMQFWRFSRCNVCAPVSQMGKHSYCLWDTSYVLWIHFKMNIPICFLPALPGDDAHLVLAKHDTGTLFGGCCLLHNFSLSLVHCHRDIFYILMNHFFLICTDSSSSD